MIDNSSFELADRYWVLTTEHPASHYGKPVLIETDRFGRHIGQPIGPQDKIALPVALPARSLGLEIEASQPGTARDYTGAEIVGYAAHPGTRDAYLSQQP